MPVRPEQQTARHLAAAHHGRSVTGPGADRGFFQLAEQFPAPRRLARCQTDGGRCVGFGGSLGCGPWAGRRVDAVEGGPQPVSYLGQLGPGGTSIAVSIVAGRHSLVEEVVGAVDKALERDAPGCRVGVEERRLLGRGDPIGRRPRRVFEFLYVLHVQYGGHSRRRVRPGRKSTAASMESLDCRPPPPEGGTRYLSPDYPSGRRITRHGCVF